MNIGHFYTDTVTVYTVTESISSVTGENVKSSSTGVSLKCKVRPLTNYEKFIQNKNNLETTHRVYCGYSTCITALDRIVYSNSTFEIISMITPFNKRDFMQVDIRVIQ